MAMQRKALLSEGTSVAVLALSSPCARDRFQRGIEALQSFGIAVEVPLDPACAYGKKEFLFSAASAAERLTALRRALSSRTVGAVLCARGGYGAIDLLPKLPTVFKGKRKKTIIGFSDSTIVLVAADRSGFETIHGPSLESGFSHAAADADARVSCQELLRTLTMPDPQPLAKCALESLVGKGRVCRGKIIGGNLSVLCGLVGTPWFPVLNGRILFLEETAERPYRIHRMLRQMVHSGKLRGLRGVLLGDFDRCEFEHGPTLRDVLQDVFEPLGVQVFGFLPSGHRKKNLPVIFGRPARVDRNGVRYS